jgi:hypothetical protein
MEDTTEISMFQPPTYTGNPEDDYSPAMNSYPTLQSPLSGSIVLAPRYEPPQVRRYLTENQSNSLFTASPRLSTMNTNMVVSSPLQPRSVPGHGQLYAQFRVASPISSLGYPGTAPSATPDRETFYDNNNTNNLPSTPSDTAVMSPRVDPSHFDLYSVRDDPMQYVHMGPPGYIKPEDVEPSQQLGYPDPESSQSRLQLGRHRSGYPLEHNTITHQMMESTQDQSSLPFQNRHSASPDADAIIVKQRSRHGPHNSYPPLFGNVVDYNDNDDHGSSDVSEQSPVSKRKKDEDPEFLPGKKRRTSSASTRKSKAKPASGRLRSGEGSQKAKPKTTSKEITHASHPACVDPYSSGRKMSHPCPHCEQGQFQDSSSLESHIKKQHTRPFICVLHFAGCKSTFASKNEWKRHVLTQHVALFYWHCTEGTCGGPSHASPSSTSSSSNFKSNNRNIPNTYTHTLSSPLPATTSSTPSPPTHGNVFNRKDLYTQHLRRMHAKPSTKKALKAHAAAMRSSTKRPTASSSSSSRPTELELIISKWEDHVRKSQSAAKTERVNLPTYMRCPAANCGVDFHGKTAWDDRMEHVAKHLESGDRKVVFGGDGDGTLMAWLAGEGLGVVERDGAGWRLGDPLKRGKDSGRGKKGGKPEGGEDEDGDGNGEMDAEGEDDDDE